MKKKQFRKMIHTRKKRIDQNARFQKRQEDRREAMRKFKVEIIPHEKITNEYVEALAREQSCFLCREAISDEQVVDRHYVAFRSKKADNFYFVHRAHFYKPPESENPSAGQETNMRQVFFRIFEREEGHRFREPGEKKGGEQ